MDVEEDNKVLEENGRHKQVLPVDRGWAWIILLACFCKLFLIVGTLKSFGLFFVEFLRAYNTTASMVSLVLSIQTAMFSFAAFFILTLGHRFFSARQIIMTGGFVAALGYFLNGFAPTVTFLIFSQGILHASGCAASYGPALVLLSTYFEKKKGLANSLANVGGSVGSLVIPLFIRYLLDTFGLQGALMIMSGLLFNITAAGALMKPFPTQKPVKTIHNENDIKLGAHEIVEDIAIEVQDIDYNLTNGSMKTYVPTVTEEDGYPTKFIQLNHQISKISSTTNGSTISVNKLSGSTLDIYGSTANIAAAIPVITIGHSVTTLDGNQSLDGNSKKQNCCSDLFAFGLLKNHRFQLLMLTGFLCIFGSALTITFIPPFAKDYKVPDDKIALLITISAICDFVGRFSVAWVADSGVLRRNHLVGICVCISGIAAMLNFLYTDFPSFAVYAAIYGLVGGVYFSLYPLLIVEALGQENLAKGLAIQFQVHGISLMINSFLIGYIRDVTGSFHNSFFLMGTGLLLGTVCLFCEPLARRLEDKRIKRLQLSSSNIAVVEQIK